MMRFSLALVVFITYSALTNILKVSAYRKFDLDNGMLYLVSENEQIDLECKNNDMPMSYCGFAHPTGKRYSFSKYDFLNGKCIIKINVTNEDVGEWRCHIGENAVGVETTQKINLRIAEKFAALRTKVTIESDKSLQLRCVTAQRSMPIRYCRFEPPKELPFGIDASVNESKPLRDKYYFPSHMSLDRGDCAVVIMKAKVEDQGLWMCGAGFDNDREYVDNIQLFIIETGVSTSTVLLGLLVGVIILALIVLCVYILKKRCCPSITIWRSGNEQHEMQPLSSEEPERRVRPPVVIPEIVIEPPTPCHRVVRRPLKASSSLLQPGQPSYGRSKRQSSRPHSWADPISAISFIDAESNSPITVLPWSKDKPIQNTCV